MYSNISQTYCLQKFSKNSKTVHHLLKSKRKLLISPPLMAEQSLWHTLENMNISEEEFNTARMALGKKWSNDVRSSQKLALELNEAEVGGEGGPKIPKM